MPARTKILILSASLSDNGSLYAQLARHLRRILADEVCFAYGEDSGNRSIQDTGIQTFHRFVLPPSIALDRLGAASITLNEERMHFLFRRVYFLQLKKLVQEISKFAQDNGVSRIVSFLDHPAIIWLTRRVASALSVPYSTFAATVPETMLVFAGYDTRSSNQLVQEFRDTLTSANHALFSTHEMCERYSNNLGITGKAIEMPLIPITKRQISQSNKITIGCMLNSMYSNGISSLISTLQKNEWKVHDTAITLKLIGTPVGIEFAFNGLPASIEILSGLSDEGKVNALADCTINYVPYWTSPDFTLSAKLTFPVNFEYYLSAGKPLIAHALIPSMVSNFIAQHRLGSTIISCTEDVFWKVLSDVLQNVEETDIRFENLKEEINSNSDFAKNVNLLVGR